MTEKVAIRQNNHFGIQFWYTDPEKDTDEFYPVQDLHELTPYGLMLLGLATCTAQVVISYANHHELLLDAVELRVAYHRTYPEGRNAYTERIEAQMAFFGDLSRAEREKLEHISRQCPIEKMYKDGLPVHSELVEEFEPIS